MDEFFKSNQPTKPELMMPITKFKSFPEAENRPNSQQSFPQQEQNPGNIPRKAQ